MKSAAWTALLACLLAGCVGYENPDEVPGDNPGDTTPVDTPVGDGGGGDGGVGDGTGKTPDKYVVATLGDGSPSPVVFAIDCSRLSEPSKSNCKPFLENTARRVAPALRKITGVKLEARCPTITYVIYAPSGWPHPGAGGMALGNCQIDYLVDAVDSQYSAGPFGPYDVHELLHQHQYLIPALLNGSSHPLFASTQGEAEREIGDQASYQRALDLMRTSANNPNPVGCRQVQDKLESALYLNDSTVVYRFYQTIDPGITDTSTQASYLLYLASGRDEGVKKTLRDAGCPVNFR